VTVPRPRLLASLAFSTVTAGALAAAAITGTIPGWQLSAAANAASTPSNSASSTPSTQTTPASPFASAGGFSTMGTTGAGAKPSATSLPSTGQRKANDITVSGLPSFNGGPAVVPPTVNVPSFAQPWPSSSQWQFTDNVPGVALSGVQHYVGTSASGVVVLPAGPGEPHLLCAGNLNPLTAYSLDNSNGQWTVQRYDAGTNFDFYYRWVRGYYLQTASCS
jgi:hypothetical protein